MIKVIHGDSKEILKTLNFTDKTIIVTDPPLNISYGYKTYKDKMPEQDYWKMLKDMFQNRKCVVIQYSEQPHRVSIELRTAPTKTVSWVYNSNTAKQHREIAFYNIQPDLLEVMCNIIGFLPKDAEIIEPFGGSGTTAEAIKIMNEKQNANRTGIIIEIDEVYIEIIKNRIK